MDKMYVDQHGAILFAKYLRTQIKGYKLTPNENAIIEMSYRSGTYEIYEGGMRKVEGDYPISDISELKKLLS